MEVYIAVYQVTKWKNEDDAEFRKTKKKQLIKATLFWPITIDIVLLEFEAIDFFLQLL